jgi:hypothetical protein
MNVSATQRSIIFRARYGSTRVMAREALAVRALLARGLLQQAFDGVALTDPGRAWLADFERSKRRVGAR